MKDTLRLFAIFGLICLGIVICFGMDKAKSSMPSKCRDLEDTYDGWCKCLNRYVGKEVSVLQYNRKGWSMGRLQVGGDCKFWLEGLDSAKVDINNLTVILQGKIR